MSHGRLFCVVLLDMAGLLKGGSGACMHAVAEERIRLDVSLCLTGCQACSAALAQQTQFTSFCCLLLSENLVSLSVEKGSFSDHS